MKKVVFLILSILCIQSCEMFHTGGNPDEGPPCKGVTKNHAKKYYFELTLKCPYKNKCDVKFYFDAGYYSDSLGGQCFSDYELNFVTREISKRILSAKEYNVSLESDDHLRFSLIDINDVEKKYDIDLSGIIYSYTVRDDSVEIKMPVGNFDMLVECPYCVDYGRSYSLCEGGFLCHYHSKTSLSAVVGTSSSWGKEFTFHYGLSNLSSMQADSVYIHGTIGFR